MLNKIIILCLALFCLTSFVSPPIALLMGIGLSQSINNPFEQYTRSAAQRLLQLSVIGLGFGLNIHDAIQISKERLALTVGSIALTLLSGFVIGKLLSVNSKTSWLISFGTAICGGSAIAAMAPIIDAKENETSSALVTIFILNAVALLLFPYIGNLLVLDPKQFGLWVAIAIHDTSSVVGAAQKFSADAVQVATTVKLARALWIIPLSLIVAFGNRTRWGLNFPFFIFFFIAATVATTSVPQLESLSPSLVAAAKKGLTLSLFLIGLGFAKTKWESSNLRPMVMGIVIWLIISISSLYFII